jgi:hypothetical protein
MHAHADANRHGDIDADTDGNANTCAGQLRQYRYDL